MSEGLSALPESEQRGSGQAGPLKEKFKVVKGGQDSENTWSRQGGLEFRPNYLKEKGDLGKHLNGVMDYLENRGDQVSQGICSENEASVEEMCQALGIDYDEKKQKEVKERWRTNDYAQWEIPGRPDFNFRIENRIIDGREGTLKMFWIGYRGEKR